MAKRPSLSSSNPEVLMKLLEGEEAAAAAANDYYKIGIEDIIQNHLQTLNQSYNRIQKLLETSSSSSLIHSYKRLGRIHEVESDHVVFNDSSNALQKDIQSSIEVAQNITTIFKSILPRHTLDYVYDKERFFLVNFSKSEDLKVSKFQKETDYVRNKIVEMAVKLYSLRTSRIKRSVVETIQYGEFRKYGELVGVDYIETFLANKDFWENRKKVKTVSDARLMKMGNLWEKYNMKDEITERDEIMIKIEKAMKDLEGILFEIYVMVQTQVAISEYAISEKWSGGKGHHHNIESLVVEERNKTTLLSKGWFTSKINDIYYYCLH